MEPRNQKLTPEEKKALKGRIFDELGLSKPEKPVAGRFGWRIVAAVIALVTVPLLYLITQHSQKPAGIVARKITVRAAAGESRRITLPDSSAVLLNAGSELSWSEDFLRAPGREVSLTGNAFFSVRKKPAQKNFTVHTGSLDIAVLGTEFNVNARTAQAEVSLVKGKVFVSLNGNDSIAATLAPGEQIRLDAGRSQLIRSGFNPVLYSAWTENKWNFSRTRLDEILRLVRDYYGVTPVFAKEEKKALKITASITVGRLEDLITVIESTLQIRIVKQNNQLLVQ